MLDPNFSTGPPRFDPPTSNEKPKLPHGKLFNAVKRFVALIIKPFLAKKVEAPKYEFSAAHDGPHGQAGGHHQCGELPAYAEVEQSHQQPVQYNHAFQAPFHQYCQPGQVQSQQESQHDYQSKSSIQTPNTIGPDSLEGYCATYEDPGPPDGYITTESGRQIPFWWNPPRTLVPPMNHRRSHW